MTPSIIQDQFGILQNFHTSAILQTSFLVGTFFDISYMKTALDKVFRSWIFQNVELINEINYETLNWTIYSNKVLPELGARWATVPPQYLGTFINDVPY